MDQRERVTEFGRELREGPELSDRSIKEIVDALRPQVQQLVAKQVEMARIELTPVARQAGVAAGLLVVGAVFLFLFLLFFFLAGMYIMNAAGFPPWASAGINAVILLAIGGILAGAGANILRGLDPKPHKTMHTLQQNINWLKGQFRS